MSSKKKAVKKSAVVAKKIKTKTTVVGSKSKTSPKNIKVQAVQSANGFFIISPAYNKLSDIFSGTAEIEVSGPLSEKEAIKAIDDKVKDGCERSSITVISGRKISVQVRLQ